MGSLLDICESLAAKGKIKKIGGGFFVGTARADDPKVQKIEREYAEAFEKRKSAREAKEREAEVKMLKHGPKYCYTQKTEGREGK